MPIDATDIDATDIDATDIDPKDFDPTDFRHRVMERGLARRDLDPDPLRQFERWYGEIVALDPPEPNAMTLCSVDAQGQPFARTVLLKLYDARGFVFFTNYESRKARQIDANPRVALLFPWVAVARQIQIQGRAERIPTLESLRYFATRPRGSQIGAWASPQSRAIRSRALLEAQVAEMRRRFADGEIPLPDFWGGYRVVPERIEFWQGRESRLHDRFEYRRPAADAESAAGDGNADARGGWLIERLAP